MNPINEQDFRMSCQAGAVSSVTITEVESGHIVVCTLSWREGKFTLYTQRNRPRTWASVNTLIDYLKRQGLKLDFVTLTLKHRDASSD